MEYPEHKKLEKARDDSHLIGEFLEWLTNEKQIRLCTYEKEGTRHPDTGEFVLLNKSIEQLLAEYFGIDLNKLEKENQQILEEQRKLLSE